MKKQILNSVFYDTPMNRYRYRTFYNEFVFLEKELLRIDRQYYSQVFALKKHYNFFKERIQDKEKYNFEWYVKTDSDIMDLTYKNEKLINRYRDNPFCMNRNKYYLNFSLI